MYFLMRVPTSARRPPVTGGQQAAWCVLVCGSQLLHLTCFIWVVPSRTLASVTGEERRQRGYVPLVRNGRTWWDQHEGFLAPDTLESLQDEAGERPMVAEWFDVGEGSGWEAFDDGSLPYVQITTSDVLCEVFLTETGRPAIPTGASVHTTFLCVFDTHVHGQVSSSNMFWPHSGVQLLCKPVVLTTLHVEAKSHAE